MLDRDRDHGELSEDGQARETDGMSDTAASARAARLSTHWRPDRSDARALSQPTIAASRNGGRLMSSAASREPASVRATVG